MADKEKIVEGGEAQVVAVSAAPPAKSSIWPLAIVLLVGVPLTCYLMINFLVLPKLVAAIGTPAAAHGAADAGAAPGQHGAASKEVTVDFGKIMVNLTGTEGNRYLRINLVFASNNPELKEVIKASDVPLRDGVITVLSAQSLADLEGNEGRETARRALISRVNGILGGPVVTQIYFTDFVIQ